MPFAEVISTFFNADEFASQATWGAFTANVILDTPTEDVLGGRAQSIEYEAKLPSAQFPGIKRGDTVVIASTTYAVREVKLLDDGAIKSLSLSKS
jgi:hypothetical protein